LSARARAAASYIYPVLQGLLSSGMELNHEANIIAGRLAERGTEIAKPE